MNTLDTRVMRDLFEQMMAAVSARPDADHLLAALAAGRTYFLGVEAPVPALAAFIADREIIRVPLTELVPLDDVL
ncbi:hypothetical protein [Geodermatophilus ruber]|uniref:Uncharacterized protein n=1 Tax=Geodermatophilus ruber TaxID=504800 RepID=A0A1I3Z367_9ACTN|nr:hypothetical protein [Geodermatophilus ruber]SFK38498.1 hypothetical protein SAMN04488085_101324 [Geodermatophilus ruber]